MPALTASRPSFSIKIDKVRQVRYTWASACRFEDAFGMPIPNAMMMAVGVRLITHLAWAGMLDYEPALTIKDTEKRLQSFINQGGDISDLAHELVKALSESGVLGKAKAEDKEVTEGEGEEGNESAGE